MFKKNLLHPVLLTAFLYFSFAIKIYAQVPCNQRVLDNVDFQYNKGTAPARWNANDINKGGFTIDQSAFNYVASGNFATVNTNFSGGTNNSTRQYAIVANPNTLSPQYANIPTDGMLVINPMQGNSDQYITYSMGNLIAGNTYTIEIKVWNVIDMAMPGQCQSWCNWNDQLYIDMANNQPGAEHSNQNNQNWTGTNGNGNWSQGTNQVDRILKISSGGSYAIITGTMTMPATGNVLNITLAKGSSSNPVVLGIDYIKIYGCQAEAVNVSGGSTNVCEGTDLTLTAQGLGSAGSTYSWYQNGVLMPGRTSDTLNIYSAVGAGTTATYEARGEWANKSVTLTSKVCCSSVGGTSDEVIRQSFNGLTYTCTAGRSGGYADIPDKGVKNFIDPAYTYSGISCDGLNDGHYAVVQSSFAGDYWRINTRPEVKDHTGVAGSGALFINAIGGVGQAFYRFNLDGLCNGTRYEFSAYYASLAAGSEIKPNIEFQVLNGATKIESVSTGIIPVNEQWYKAEVTFVTPTTGNPTYTLQLVNLVTGASGNDVMIDDIVVKKCTPSINLFQDGTKDSVVSVCNDNAVNLKVTTFYDLPLVLTGSSSGTVYYQWMEATSPNGPWTLIGSPETTGAFAATPVTTTKYYRAKVSADQTRAATGLPPSASECGNDGMTTSFKLTKDGNFTVPPVTGTTAYCAGSTITLTGDPGTGTEWEWRKGTSFATATVLTGYAFNSDPAKKVFTKTFAATDAGTYYFVARLASGCEGNASIVVTATPVASATISGATTVCQNATGTTITLTGANGTAPYTFTYTINGGTAQNISTTTGSSSVNVPVSTGTSGSYAYNLTGVSGSGTSSCSNNNVTGQSATVVVNALPSASVGGTVTVQQNATSPKVTFTGSNGTAPYTFTYNINGGASQNISTASGSNIITVDAPTGTAGTFNYNLVSVKDANAVTCTNNVTGTATITISNLPGAAITTSATAACKNGTGPTVTFTGSNGTAPYTFTYNLNGGANQIITTSSGNSVTITAPVTSTGNLVYTVTQVKESSATPITNAVTGQSVTIAVSQPTAPAVTNNSRCGTGTVALSATVSGASSNTLTWYSDAALTTQVATGTTYTTPNITGTTNYYVTETSGAGCISPSATVTATVNPGPAVPKGTGASRCGTGTVPLAATLTGSAGNIIKWYSDAGLTTQVATGISFTTPSLSSTTDYYITESNAAGCASASVTVRATISAVPGAPTPTDGARCGTGTVILGATGTGGTIKWYSDVALTTQVATGSSYTTPSITATTNYYITETSAASCAGSSATVKAIVSPVPTAGFTASVDCSNKSATFTNTSNGNGGTITKWAWNFDDGGAVQVRTDGNAFDWPYPTGGTHTVALTVETSDGCSNATAFTQTIVFGAIPVADFTVGDLCVSNGAATFTNTSTISNASLMTYTWDFGDGTTLNITPAAAPVPASHTYAAGGNYTVKLTANSNGGCANTVSKPISIVDIPTASGTVDNINNLCSNKEVKLTNTSTITGSGTISKVEVYWEYPDLNNKTTDNQPAPGTAYTHSYPEFGTPQTKNYTVVIRAYNVNGCSTDFSQSITVLASPEIQLTPLAGICLTAAPIDINSSVTETFGLGGAIAITGDGVSGTIFTPSAAGAGTHTISYTATAANGCADTDEQSIVVREVPVNKFSASYAVFENQSLKLVPVAPMNSDLTYLWSPGYYLDNTSSPTPTVTNPVEDITYSLKLTSADNCSLDTTVQVIVLSNFTVPNTFTPNNDGYFDTWVIKKLNKYPSHRVQVFNRYGQLVYETSSFPAGGWDGKYKGSLLPFGTYYYIIELGGMQKPKTGYVTIVK